MRKKTTGGIYSKMRILRVAFALAVFVLVSAQFLDIYHKLPDAYYIVHPTSTQFAPSLLNLLATGAIISGAAFITFAVTALVFGRAYCSFVCPFGILMDIARRAAKFPAGNALLKKTRLGAFCKKHFAVLHFAEAKNSVRFFFTGLAAASIIFGFTALFGLLEPYSLYGKIMASAGHIGVSTAFNTLSSVLSDNGIYSVPPINGDISVALAAFGFSIAVLVLIALAAALRGRLYCNTLCPVGGFLGMLSKFSLFRLELGNSQCLGCGMCERECKAQCIDVKNKNIDFSRCVMCLNCVNVCTRAAIGFKLNPIYRRRAKDASESEIKQTETPLSSGRRDFVKLSPALAAFFCVGAKAEKPPEKAGYEIIKGATPYGMKGHRADKRLAVPPGALSLKNFTEHCTGCQICVSACPTQILKPSITEWGLVGFMQPYMDFDVGFCVHACRDCSRVCPTGAIQEISEAEKLTEKIGTAVFIKDLCVVYTDGTDCAACAEHCPVSAIEMIPYKPEKSLYIPHVHSEVCIGCGACEHICPVLQKKAIVVQGLARHEKAKVFDQSMRLYVPQRKDSAAPAEQPKPLDNPFPF